MKKAFTLIELLVVLVLVFILAWVGFVFTNGGINGYTIEEILLPQETQARHQREMVEELRRANDLKEREKE